MRTKLSTKGQVVLPGHIRERLGLRPGDALEASVEGGRIVLTPHRSRHFDFKIISDPLTGLPVLSAAGDVPLLTTEQVEEILADFP